MSKDHKEKDHMDEKQEKFEKHKVPLDPPGLEEHQKGAQQKQEHVLSKEEKQAIENARLGIRDDLPAMQKANLEEDKRVREQTQRDREVLKGQPGAPGQGPLLPEQLAISGGETVTIASVTLASLLSSLYVTNTAPTAPTIATWVAPGVLQGVYGDMSLFTVRFEARAYVPSQIRVT